MKVRISIGGKNFTGDGTSVHGILDKFVAETEKVITKTLTQVVAGKAKRVAAALEKHGLSENRSIFRTIAILINANSTGNIYGGEIDSAGVRISEFDNRFNKSFPRTSHDLQWRPLSPTTVRRKKRDAQANLTPPVLSGSANKYFLRTGTLRKFFKDNATSLGDALGPLKVTFRDASGRFMSVNKNKNQPVATISVSFMSKVNKALLPGFRSGNWTDVDKTQKFERSIIHDPDVLEKLKGGEYFQRPLVQPIINYYLLYRMPQVLYSTISKVMREASVDPASKFTK